MRFSFPSTAASLGMSGAVCISNWKIQNSEMKCECAMCACARVCVLERIEQRLPRRNCARSNRRFVVACRSPAASSSYLMVRVCRIFAICLHSSVTVAHDFGFWAIAWSQFVWFFVYFDRVTVYQSLAVSISRKQQLNTCKETFFPFLCSPCACLPTNPRWIAFHWHWMC